MAAAASLRARRAHSTQPNPRAEPLLPIHLPLHPVSLSHPTPAPRTATPAPQRPAAARAVAQTHQDEQQSPSLAFPSAHAAGADMEQALLAQVRRQVVQVRTLHRLPSSVRPWENGVSVESSSSAFVIDPSQGLLMTTAGAVEAARRVTVCRADSDTEVPAQVIAVCPDADVALIRVKRDTDVQPDTQAPRRAGLGASRRAARGGDRSRRTVSREERFWSGLVGTEWGPLPALQEPVCVAGFPIGGESLAVTQGVMSRCEVVEYSHSNRHLLALQVDAPLNNGVWGGPVYDRGGRVLGMAFQKFTTQTWMERYDEEGLPGYADPEGGDSEGEGDEGEQGAEGEYEDPGVENVGYCVPAMHLQHILEDWAQRTDHDAQIHTTTGTTTAQPTSPTQTQTTGKSPQGDSTTHDGPEAETSHEMGDMAGARHSHAASAHHGHAAVTVLHSFPSVGVRWRPLESPALRAMLGMGPSDTGIIITATDPSASCAGVIHPGDVLTHLGPYTLANDGTITLRPGQRVMYGHAAALKHVGDTLQATVIRNGQKLNLSMRLVHSPPILPATLSGAKPLYLILSGLVLLQLTLPLLYARQFPRGKGRRLRGWGAGYLGVAGALEWGIHTMPGGEQVILSSELLSDTVAYQGYNSELGSTFRRLVSVDGVRVLNMSHLISLIFSHPHTHTHTHNDLTDTGTNVAVSTHDESRTSGRGESSARETGAHTHTHTHQDHTDTGTDVAVSTHDEARTSSGDHASARETEPHSHTHKDLTHTDTATQTDTMPTKPHSSFLRLEFSDGSVMVLDRLSLKSDTSDALARHGISHAMSDSLAGLLPEGLRGWPGEAGAPSVGRQKRQQRRRLAVRR